MDLKVKAVLSLTGFVQLSLLSISPPRRWDSQIFATLSLHGYKPKGLPFSINSLLNSQNLKNIRLSHLFNDKVHF